MDEENGCTEVLPGTHFISDEQAVEQEKRKGFELARAIPLRLKAGDMAAIHPKVLHGGGVNRSDRERNVVVIQFGVVPNDFLWEYDEPYCGLRRSEILARREAHPGNDRASETTR